MGVSEMINEELSYHMAFTIPGINLPVPMSVVTTWGIIVFLGLVSFLLTRKLEIVPGKRQIVVEAIVGVVVSLFGGYLGEKGRKYLPFVGTLFLYLCVANTMGIFGFTPPTKDMNTTLGMAIISIILVQVVSIRERGPKGWLKGFSEPIGVMLPMNILELVIKPTSLCMRLFGNVLGAFVIMELLKYAIPMILPMAASMYFDIFDGLLQAFVFTFLTSLYIQEAIGEEEE